MADSGPGTPAPLRILVVEDEPDIRSALVEILKLDGHRVAAAANGNAALRVLDAEQIDAILLDIGLPEMDGIELARRIRARCGRAPYLIALTGYSRQEDRAATAAAGFDAHLTKPCHPDELGRILASISPMASEQQR